MAKPKSRKLPNGRPSHASSPRGPQAPRDRDHYTHDRSRPPTEIGLAIIAAILASDEPLTEIAKRFGRSKANVSKIYSDLIESGEIVPERRPGRIPSMTSEPDTTGGRIAAMRLSRGLSQRKLAGMLDPPATQSVIARAEKSGDGVAPELVRRIAKAMRCRMGELDGR